MKQLLIFISLFLALVCNINAQSITANQFNGRLQMTTVSNVSDSTWSITGYFTNSVNKYTTTQIAVNDKFFCQIGANTYVGRISVINSASDVTKLITFRVICNYPNPPNNIGAIVRATSNGYPVFVDGLPNALQAGIQNYFATLVNTNAAGSPCEQTITKTSHGFRKFTPVRWNGTTFVRPTHDTLVPDYIVVDSLSANTFKVATCGTYATVLPNGLYWYTNESPGYSLTPDTTKAPLFQVIDSTLLLNPIVGFNLMSGSGGTADGNGIYSGSDSLSQENTYAAMAADGSQTYAQGNWPSFPDRDYDYVNEYGVYISPNNEVTLAGKRSQLTLYDGFVSLATEDERNAVFIDADQHQTILIGGRNTQSVKVDSFGILVGNGNGFSNSYRLIPSTRTTRPSTTSGVTNILKWTAGVPSFGYRYETDTIVGNVYLKMPNAAVSNTAIGYFPNFPDPTYNSSKGLYISHWAWGSVGMFNNRTSLELDGNNASLFFNSVGGNRTMSQLSANQAGALVIGRKISSSTDYHTLRVDSIGAYWSNDLAGAYQFLPDVGVSAPSTTSGAISNLIWTAGTPSFLRSQHGVATGTTDGAGDLTVTFAAAMPDATYSLIATVEGTTSYTISVHTKATGTCKVRFFNPATGAAVTATSVTISYEAKDY